MTTPTSGLRHLNAAGPAFRARITQGDRSLADDRDNWALLFAPPAGVTQLGAAQGATTTRRANPARP